jgi:hypothetical protein
MRDPSLHLGRWNSPHGRFVVDLRPFGTPQFPRSHEDERRKAKGNPGDRETLALVAFHRTEQFADPFGFQNSGKVLRPAFG